MQGKTILIIDDDLPFSEMLSEILKDEGAEVLVEHDGASGLASALQHKPDLLMIDVMMPRMTGVDVLKALRQDSWGKTVPALMLTNMAQTETVADTIENGPATEYLLKVDWTLDQIAERIKKILA